MFNYLNTITLDIRVNNNIRFMDQKVTPDVLSVIADCILNFVNEKSQDKNIQEVAFSVADIWNSPYAKNIIPHLFAKPTLHNKTAGNEYDKFFAQPLNSLAYADILTYSLNLKPRSFKIKRLEELKKIAQSERYALIFLTEYCTKIFLDSGISHLFERLERNQDKNTYESVKQELINFIYEYTNIVNKKEPWRILAKMVNPILFSKKLKCYTKGKMNIHEISISDLMYNRINWKDAGHNKPKSLTRKENKLTFVEILDSNYEMTKAKNLIRLKHDNKSEIYFETDDVLATQVHHIFMKSEFPEFYSLLENLILLTPNQHFTKAHPNNNTQVINREYQLICLLSKLKSIFLDNDNTYDIKSFIFLISSCLDVPKENMLKNKENFEFLNNAIKDIYKNKFNILI